MVLIRNMRIFYRVYIWYRSTISSFFQIFCFIVSIFNEEENLITSANFSISNLLSLSLSLHTRTHTYIYTHAYTHTYTKTFSHSFSSIFLLNHPLFIDCFSLELGFCHVGSSKTTLCYNDYCRRHSTREKPGKDSKDNKVKEHVSSI